MAKVVNDISQNTSPPSHQKNFYGNKVSTIDPKIAIQNLQGRNIYSNTGLMSPTYSQLPSIGSVLQTPKDNTRIKIPSSKPSSTTFSNLPKVPPKKHLLNYGMVAPAETIHTNYDFLNEFPDVPQALPQAVPQAIPHTAQEKVDEAKFRANYRVKFSILRDAYQQMNIPEPHDDQSTEEIKAMYEQYVRRIMIDQSVEQNNVYLLILWLVIEVIGGRFFKMPLKGYTKNQFKYMSKYRMLLIELGERNQSAGIGDGWPVELRILAMAAFNGVIFVLVQMLAKRIGTDGDQADNMANELREMINSFLTQNKGTDVLKKAEQADVDHPPSPLQPEDNSPPLGNLGSILANVAGMFSGGGGDGLSSLFGNAGSKKTTKPKMKKPTTFGSRRKKSPNNET